MVVTSFGIRVVIIPDNVDVAMLVLCISHSIGISKMRLNANRWKAKHCGDY